ncbi:MAG: hypothetical protein J0I15_24870, partial [Herbaspirillum huttiense]|uniref:hypothetical protein n=1 Tax=Herbaspirillum huttiense TaxID=863372 RepID=UPI001ACD151C
MNKKNSKGVVERHLKQIQAKVRRPGIDRLRGIQTFKASFADTHFFDGFKKLFPLRASLHDYHGTPFPKYASQLFSNKAPRNPVQAYREILWAIARCSQFSDEISDFLTIRAEFESAVLKNNFQNAARSLREIEDRFGKSIWLYQNIISSAYISGSTQEPGVLAKQVVDEVKNTPILNLLVYYIRKRIEGAVLREKLGREIESHINSTFLSSYYQKKIFDVADSSDAAVTALLFLDAQASIIDHYDSLILSLQAAVADSMFVDEMTKVIKPALRQLHRKTRDRRLLGVLHLMGDDLGATSNDLDARRAQSIELYTIGEYDQCVGITKEILEEHPEDSPIRILYVKALVSLGRRPPSTNDLSSEINDNLYNVLAVTDQFFRSTHAIMVLSDRFLDHHWMLYLRVAVHYEVSAEQEKPIPAWMRDMYVRDPNLTPFLAMTLSSEDRVRFLSNCRLQEAYPHTLQLVSDFFSDDDSDTNNISPRSARYRARGSLVRKNYKRAFELYFLAAENEKNIAAKLKSLGGASLALMLDGQHHLAVDTLVDAYLNYQQAPILLPFHSLSHRLAEVDEWPNTIKLGILFHLANLFDEEGDLSRQRLAFEKFCTDNAITSPTDLMKREAEYGRE